MEAEEASAATEGEDLLSAVEKVLEEDSAAEEAPIEALL